MTKEINYNNLITLTSELKRIYECKEMQHAWRFNGIVDVFKYGNNVYNKVANTHHKFNSMADLEMFVLGILKQNKSQSAFEVKGKVSYKDFKKKVMPLAVSSVMSEKAEDYHWKVNTEIKDDDMYFLFHNGFVKIGRTNDMARRIIELKTSLSCEYECFVFQGKGYLEKKYHHIFSDFRQSGEWFLHDDRFVAFVSKRLFDGSCVKFDKNTKPKPKERKERAPKAIKQMDMDSMFFFGKHKGKRIKDVLMEDIGYFEWMEINVENFHQKYHPEVHAYMRKHSASKQLELQ